MTSAEPPDLSSATARSGPAVRVPPQLEDLIARIEGDERLDRLGGPLARAGEPIARGSLGPVLRGEWLGHAFHPLLTDLPLGCWLAAGLLDVLGPRDARDAARRLVGLGLCFVPITVATGLVDLREIREPRTRRAGIVHGVGNVAVAGTYFLSWRARRAGHHARGTALGLAGGALAWFTGYLGGHLSFARHAGTGPRGLSS